MQLLVNSTCVLLSMCCYMDYKKNDNDIHACINGYAILYILNQFNVFNY